MGCECEWAIFKSKMKCLKQSVRMFKKIMVIR